MTLLSGYSVELGKTPHFRMFSILDLPAFSASVEFRRYPSATFPGSNPHHS